MPRSGQQLSNPISCSFWLTTGVIWCAREAGVALDERTGAVGWSAHDWRVRCLWKL